LAKFFGLAAHEWSFVFFVRRNGKKRFKKNLLRSLGLSRHRAWHLVSLAFGRMWLGTEQALQSLNVRQAVFIERVMPKIF